MSLALQHKRKALAAKMGATIISVDMAKGMDQTAISNLSTLKKEAFAALKESLPNDLITLKHANGDAERDPFKKELVKKYRDYAQTMMKHQNWGGQKVIFYWLLWRLDLEDYQAVHADLLSAVKHGLTTPDEFKRNWPTFYLDSVYKYSNEAFKAEKEFNADYLENALKELNTGGLVTNAPLKSKLFALSGKIAFKEGDFKTAVKNFETALNLDEGVGVKTLLKQAKGEQK